MLDPRRTSIAALALSLAAWATAGWTYLRVEGLEAEKRWARNVEDLRISLEIVEPTNQSEAHGAELRIGGNVSVAHTRDAPSPDSVEQILTQSEIEIVPIARALGYPTQWWVQMRPMVRPDGRFDGVVWVGEPNGVGVGLDFEIVVLAVPRGSLQKGETVAEIPLNYATSSPISVKRVS
ncbi:MAG: hypothetical protein FJ207_15125 [Gemmatimonadetes bacterium]|nr:hypothetical protein [Gemmatimonadota bacterium]